MSQVRLLLDPRLILSALDILPGGVEVTAVDTTLAEGDQPLLVLELVGEAIPEDLHGETVTAYCSRKPLFDHFQVVEPSESVSKLNIDRPVEVEDPYIYMDTESA